MSPPRKRLLLVGWDSADWQIMRPLMERGELTGVENLVKRGISGDCATLEPQLSPMLWTSIATGRTAGHHGVHGFTEVDPASGRVVPVSAATRKCRTVWEILAARGLKSHVVGWFATQGERHAGGSLVSNLFPHPGSGDASQDPADWPPPRPGTCWPPSLAGELSELRLAPHEIDGDQILRLLVPGLDDIDQHRDKRLWHLAERLAEAYSIHAATVWLMENRPDWDFMAVYFRAIDEICHEFMPYHPPQLAGVSDRDFEMYRHVVTGAYRLHDLMLLRLIELAGPDTAVMLVSDHGFHSEQLRPKDTPNVPAGITVWHRRLGVFAAAGHGFQRGGEVHGAGLLDIAPTILHYFGLPVGEDMEGRVLAEAFAGDRSVERIASWESVAPRNPHDSASTEESARLLEHFVSLGYIEKISADSGEAVLETLRENKWNLARALFHIGDSAQALPLLEDCFFEFPERIDYPQLLAQTQLRLGLIDEADETVAVCLESIDDDALARLIKARIELEKGNRAAALGHLETLRDRASENPEILFMLARAYVANRRWEDAEEFARRALVIDPAHSSSHLVLARCALRRGDPEATRSEALAAIETNFGDPRAHLLLGVACTQLGDWDNAEAALLNHLRLQPHDPAGTRHLVHVYRGRGDIAKAAACQAVAAVRLGSKDVVADRACLENLRREIADRAADRLAARQRRRALENPSSPQASPPREFVIVSGLPRSGTSLMMQMLAAGGIEPMTDGRREADVDNPEGYYEWEPIKSLRADPQVIEQAGDRAVKVVASLLPALPAHHHYHVIYMKRPIAQVSASQLRMLGNNRRIPTAEADELSRFQEAHQKTLLADLRRNPHCRLLELSFPELVADPAPTVERLVDFLGADRLPFAPRMIAAVHPELFRNRA